MTVQMETRLTLRTFKHKKRKVTIIKALTGVLFENIVQPDINIHKLRLTS